MNRTMKRRLDLGLQARWGFFIAQKYLSCESVLTLGNRRAGKLEGTYREVENKRFENMIGKNMYGMVGVWELY